MSVLVGNSEDRFSQDAAQLLNHWYHKYDAVKTALTALELSHRVHMLVIVQAGTVVYPPFVCQEVKILATSRQNLSSELPTRFYTVTEGV